MLMNEHCVKSVFFCCILNVHNHEMDMRGVLHYVVLSVSYEKAEIYDGTNKISIIHMVIDLFMIERKEVIIIIFISYICMSCYCS